MIKGDPFLPQVFSKSGNEMLVLIVGIKPKTLEELDELYPPTSDDDVKRMVAEYIAQLN